MIGKPVQTVLALFTVLLAGCVGLPAETGENGFYRSANRALVALCKHETEIQRTAIACYAAVRDHYRQRRDAEIRNTTQMPHVQPDT